MTRKNIKIALSMLCAVLMCVPYSVYAHAGHSHANFGSGCSECSPPTLGVDQDGRRLVSGGFAINGKTFDVDFFKQHVTTETIQVGTPVEIGLKLYDDGGFADLEHVELDIGVVDQFFSGVFVEYSPVSIEWNKTFDGIESTTVNDAKHLVKDTDIHIINADTIMGLKFKFTPTEEFDASTIVVKIWDARKNMVKNYFYDALDIESDKSHDASHVIPTTLPSPESNVVIPKQSDTIVEQLNQNITCNAGQERVLRVSNMSPVCVSSYQASVLIAHNWAIPAQ